MGGLDLDFHKVFSHDLLRKTCRREDFTRISTVQDHARASWRGFRQGVHKIFSQGQVQDLAEPIYVCRPRPGWPFCASLRNWNAHGLTGAIFCKNAQVKCRRPRASKIRGGRLCVSLCSWHEHGHLTRAILEPFYRRIYKKKRNPDGAPWSSSGLYPYRKNPSVWTHRLGKKNWFDTSLIERLGDVSISLCSSLIVIDHMGWNALNKRDMLNNASTCPIWSTHLLRALQHKSTHHSSKNGQSKNCFDTSSNERLGTYQLCFAHWSWLTEGFKANIWGCTGFCFIHGFQWFSDPRSSSFQHIIKPALVAKMFLSGHINLFQIGKPCQFTCQLWIEKIVLLRPPRERFGTYQFCFVYLIVSILNIYVHMIHDREKLVQAEGKRFNQMSAKLVEPKRVRLGHFVFGK